MIGYILVFKQTTFFKTCHAIFALSHYSIQRKQKVWKQVQNFVEVQPERKNIEKEQNYGHSKGLRTCLLRRYTWRSWETIWEDLEVSQLPICKLKVKTENFDMNTPK